MYGNFTFESLQIYNGLQIYYLHIETLILETNNSFIYYFDQYFTIA